MKIHRPASTQNESGFLPIPPLRELMMAVTGRLPWTMFWGNASHGVKIFHQCYHQSHNKCNCKCECECECNIHFQGVPLTDASNAIHMQTAMPYPCRQRSGCTPLISGSTVIKNTTLCGMLTGFFVAMKGCLNTTLAPPSKPRSLQATWAESCVNDSLTPLQMLLQKPRRKISKRPNSKPAPAPPSMSRSWPSMSALTTRTATRRSPSGACSPTRPCTQFR